MLSVSVMKACTVLAFCFCPQNAKSHYICRKICDRLLRTTTVNLSTKAPRLSFPDLDWTEYRSTNLKQLEKRVKERKTAGNADLLVQKYEEFKDQGDGANPGEELMELALRMPNRTHPDVVIGDESNARLLCYLNEQNKGRPNLETPQTVLSKADHLNGLLHGNVSHVHGSRSYHFTGVLAQLENALIQYTLDVLIARGFDLVYVPDILHREVIERCGFPTKGERTQVYCLDERSNSNCCLSGTSEMALGGLVKNTTFDFKRLPVRLCSVSRCFRAEVSDVEHERGIYRVHHFTKVEMFTVTEPERSEEMHSELLDIEKQLFTELGLYCRVLDMPSEELGASAYRKFDIETWMPAKKFWGEISSTSNCTDYQSRRLGIRVSRDRVTRHTHTLNGTACAVPRLIMALLESNQLPTGDVVIPDILQSYMNRSTLLKASRDVPRTKWIPMSRISKHFI